MAKRIGKTTRQRALGSASSAELATVPTEKSLTNDHLRRLIDSGFSEREAKLYLVLIQHPDITGSELQRLSAIPRTKVYETLQRMVERKLCLQRQAGDVKRYSPVEPHLVMELRKQQMTAQIANVESLSIELTEIYRKREEEPVSVEYVEVLHSHEQVAKWLNYCVKNCRNELLVFSKLPVAVQTTKEADDVTLRSLQRIKEVRSIYEFGSGLPPNWKHFIVRWHEAGEKARFIRTLPTKIMIFDGLRALTPVRYADSKSDEVTMLLTNRELAQTFRALFEHTWKEAIPYEDFMANFEKIVNAVPVTEWVVK
jgi:sugar-specific transcriptional regulator TrmB